VVDDPERLPRAAEIVPVLSPERGFVQGIDARLVGEVAMELGAGRKKRGEAVDHAVGVRLRAQVGDPVERGQELARLHTNHVIPSEDAVTQLLHAFEIGTEQPSPRPHVLAIVTDGPGP
jgi:thymidine phosphorylase